MPSIDYLAGILDGEGWFSIRDNGRGSVFAEVGCKMTSKPIIDALASTFGGSCYFVAKEQQKDLWQWGLRSTVKDGLKLLALLDAVVPLLLEKKAQAMLLQAFFHVRETDRKLALQRAVQFLNRQGLPGKVDKSGLVQLVTGG